MLVVLLQLLLLATGRCAAHTIGSRDAAEEAEKLASALERATTRSPALSAEDYTTDVVDDVDDVDDVDAAAGDRHVDRKRELQQEPQPQPMAGNQTCFSKHATWYVRDLRHISKCKTIAGNLVMGYLYEEYGNQSVAGSSLHHYMFPDLM